MDLAEERGWPGGMITHILSVIKGTARRSGCEGCVSISPRSMPLWMSSSSIDADLLTLGFNRKIWKFLLISVDQHRQDMSADCDTRTDAECAKSIPVPHFFAPSR